jgi:ABC-type polar amino acid transport system ATPase subunit
MASECPTAVIAEDKHAWIATPENAATIQGLLDQGKRVCVRAPRGSGKTTLTCLLNVDYHVVTGKYPAQRAREICEEQKGVWRTVVTAGQLMRMNIEPGAVIAFDEFEFFPTTLLDSFLDAPGPKLFIGTPYGDQTFAEDRFDACFKW